MIKYQNALDASGNIININNVKPECRKSTQFFCISCGTEMFACLGKIKQHYFRHKKEGECSQETYLHRLGKLVLKNRFDSQPHFLVKYYVQNHCPKISHCELKERYNWGDCTSKGLKIINFKEFYDTCEDEASYQNFRADLMLTHSEHPDRKPVFLEISVTHDCEQEKLNSKIRIIEIKVQSEIDVYREIVENDGKFVEEINNQNDNDNKPPIRFYNFKRKNVPTHSLSRFYLCCGENGVYHGICKSNIITCQDTDKGHAKNACFEVTISEENIPQNYRFNLYDLGIALSHQSGFEVRNCILCAHYGRCVTSIITPVKKPSHPEPVLVRQNVWVRTLSSLRLEKMQLAYRCSKFVFYEYSCHRIIDSFKHIPYICNKKE